jgi:tetratricopeptide (TPR) repeat protein
MTPSSWCATAVAAEPAREKEPPDLRKAREQFRQGQDAYGAGRYDDAYREFAAGYGLSHRPLFLLNMGHARRRSGATSDARALYQRFLQVQPESPYRSEVEAILRELAPAADAGGAAVSPLLSAPAARGEPSASAPRAPAASLAAPVPEPEPARPRRWWLWAGAGGALVLAAVGGLVLARGGDRGVKQGSLGTLGAP